MRRILFTSATTLLFIAAVPAIADNMGMAGPSSKPIAAAAGYKFELAGAPKPIGHGKNVVAVHLMHNGQSVKGAIIITSKADMGPIGMAAMTGPIKSLGEQPPGTYRFEVSNGSVWDKADNWALSFSAKVQGEMKTVTGSVVVKLAP